MSTHLIECTVNGEAHSVEVPSRRLLSDFLRDDLHLTGTKRGCETGICGACSILLDGEVVKSCLMLAVQVQGRAITTIEGLSQGEELHPLQKNFMQCGGLQCGYCTPGMIMQAIDVLAETPNPTEEQIRVGLEGNLCRCTGYHNIVKAVAACASSMSEPTAATQGSEA